LRSRLLSMVPVINAIAAAWRARDQEFRSGSGTALA
jgi:hypothetical protein